MKEIDQFTINALDYLDQGITVFDAGLNLIQWNRHMYDLLEFPPSIFRKGTNLEDLIRFNAQRGEYGEGDVEQQVATRMQLAWEFKSHCFERVRPNGMTLEVRGNPLKNGGFVTVYSDITERKEKDQLLRDSHLGLERRVEERTASLIAANNQLQKEIAAHRETSAALQRSEEWIRNITDNIPALIAYVDTANQLKFTNANFRSYLISQKFKQSVSNCEASEQSDFLSKFSSQIKTALAGTLESLEIELFDETGDIRDVAMTIIPHFNQAKEIIGVFMLGRDITVFKATQAALLQSSKLNAIGQLTGSLAHDFGNLLTIIQGNLAYIEPMIEGVDEGLKESIDACRNTVARGSEITKRLLTFARKDSLNPTTTDIRKLLEDLESLLTRSLGEEIKFSTHLNGELDSFYIDSSQLEAALLNIVLNSKDAMPTGGKIHVNACQIQVKRKRQLLPDLLPGDYLLLSITDQGCGIPQEVLPRVIEPFFTTKGVGAGTGLGLSAVYGFVKQSQGDMRITSKPGIGTTVELYFPFSNPIT